MRTRILFMLLISILGILQAQSQFSLGKNKKMELQSIIMTKDTLRKFINEYFEDIIIDRKILIESSHSLAFENFNKRIKQKHKHFFLYGLPVNDIYANSINDSNFALYLLMDIDLKKIRTIANYLGVPENIESYSELEKGEFFFLNWNFETLSFWLDKDIFGNSKDKTTNKCILTITNMLLTDLRNKENLFSD